MKIERAALAFGVALTVGFTIVSYIYLDFKSRHETEREKSFAWELLEDIDSRYGDLKQKIRGHRPVDAKVALIAIDDESLREVGRWPWGRDLIARITERAVGWGAAGVGFDVVESEPDESHPEGDRALAATIAASSDRVVLGAFSEDTRRYLPFQDSCVTEAFLAAGGAQLIKLNPSIAIDDAEDEYDALKWGDFFRPIFAAVQRTQEEKYLKSLGKSDVAALTTLQSRFLANEKIRSIYLYCSSWLTAEDPFKPADSERIQSLYRDLFAARPELKDLPLEKVIEIFKRKARPNFIPQNVEWTGNIPVIQDAAAFTASFNAYQDPDGTVRRYPVIYRTGNRLGTSYIPSLAFQTYLLAQKYRAEIKLGQVGSHADGKGIVSIQIFDTQKDPEALVGELPVDPMGRLQLNYYGRQLSIPYVSAKDLLNEDPMVTVHQGINDEETHHLVIRHTQVEKKEFFRGRSLILGATAQSVYDLRTTPLEPNYPGPEIHATVLANLIGQDYLKRVGGEVVWLTMFVFLLGLVFSAAWAHFGAVTSFLSAIAVFALIGFVDYLLFARSGLMSTNVLLLAEILILFTATTVFKYFTEERKKKELRSTFSRYVSPAVVDEILKEPENLKLGGRKQRMSVFFSDVRGFTTISEKLAPVELAQLLNDYLTPMTEIVFQNKGTLDKYMGDAIMAFFGAPILYPDHAAHACRCALASLKRLKTLQDEFARRNLPVIDIGIGINTGEMSVGNMGSTIVQSYTVMGDSVNLASRLEGINKEYGTRIIISEFTYADVREQFICREVDRVRVKGKNEPVRIFELIQEGALSAGDQSWFDEFLKGYEAYHRRDFTLSRSHFENVLKIKVGDPVSELYVERCSDYLAEPPPDHWDGVFVMKTK